MEAVSIPYPNIIDLTLDRVLSLLDKIGNPHLKLPPIIHVAGTNGKGSTIAFISAILRASGKKLHIYTSPHLTEINERIVISNKKVAYEELISALDYCVKKKNFDPITQYELLGLFAITKTSLGFILGTLNNYNKIWNRNVKIFFLFLAYLFHFLIASYFMFDRLMTPIYYIFQIALIQTCWTFLILYIINRFILIDNKIIA